jgi:hypothetical protein
MKYGEPRLLWGCVWNSVLAASLAFVLFLVIGWPVAALTGNWSTAKGIDAGYLLVVGGIIFLTSFVIVSWLHWVIEK